MSKHTCLPLSNWVPILELFAYNCDNMDLTSMCTEGPKLTSSDSKQSRTSLMSHFHTILCCHNVTKLHVYDHIPVEWTFPLQKDTLSTPSTTVVVSQATFIQLTSARRLKTNFVRFHAHISIDVTFPFNVTKLHIVTCIMGP